jgi:hypothetical protein
MPAFADLFPRRVHCHQSVRLERPAAEVWTVVGDLSSLVPGGGAIERVELDGSGGGATRTYHLGGGVRIVERIEEYDPANYYYVYRILDTGPLPCTQYLGLAQVTPAGPASLLSWSAMANPLGDDTDALRAMLDANLAGALQAVAKHFEAA